MDPRLSNLDTLIFDLDGTLWDSTDSCLLAWTEVLAGVEGMPAPPTRALVQGVFGLKHDLIGDRLLPFLPKVRRDEVLKLCEQRECEVIRRQGGAVYPGVEAVLASLGSRYRLVLVSNCQDGYIEACFAYHGLGRFFLDFESAGRTGLAKAENLRLVIERNRLGRAIYIGDTAGDQAAAQDAGLPFVHAAYGFGAVPGADFSVADVRDLPGHFF